ncbi:MAG: sensor histidine kinase [Actinomycetes bacterium]
MSTAGGWRGRLSTRILTVQLVLVLGSLAVGALLALPALARANDDSYQRRAVAIAASLAGLPQVVSAVRVGDPHDVVPVVAASVRSSTQAVFVAITDAAGVDLADPHAYASGTPGARAGDATLHASRGVESGPHGRIAFASVPVLEHGTPIGLVTVGLPVHGIGVSMVGLGGALLVSLAGAVAVGLAAAWALHRRVRRETFGVSLRDLTSMVQEREAMLHGIQEGVLGLGQDERVHFLNDEAARLLRLPPGSVGRRLEELFPLGRMRDALVGRLDGVDQPVVDDTGRVLMVSHIPVRVDGRSLGAVVTIRDRTEPESLLRELDDVIGLTDALRAQAHEFANRLHTLAGLISLEHYDEAMAFIEEVSRRRNEMADFILARIGHPVVAALLLAKMTVAEERGIELRLSPGSRIDGQISEPGDLVTILGNLVDNAFDAIGSTNATGWVEVRLRSVGPTLFAEVADSGPGVPPAARVHVFTDGYTTKVSQSGARRGLGLALVHKLVSRRGGIITVDREIGATFRFRLPGYVTPQHPEHPEHPEAMMAGRS